jgi:glycosyltransferase involved in cell wall biosynthesis
MKIMLINHYAGSEFYGMEYRPFYMAREWVKAGHEVVIIAADYSHLRTKNPETEKNFTEENIEGITYLWIKTPSYQGNGLSRAKNMGAFITKLWRKATYLAQKYKPNAVIASSTYPFDIYPAARIAKKSGAGLFFEIHDLWPLTQIELYGFSKANPYVILLQKGEDYAYKHAARIISILPNAYVHIQERGFNTDKFVYIPNGAVIEKQNTQAEGHPYKQVFEELKQQGKFIVLYLGGFAQANALDELAQTAEFVGDNVEIVFVGDGTKKPEIIEYVNTKGYKNVLFLDRIAKSQVQAVLRSADCLYIGAKKCSLYRYGAGMNKIFDYMLAAKPIIYGIDAANDVVGDAQCGITIPAQNVQAIAQAIGALMSMSSEQRIQMGRNGYEYVLKNHDYRVLAKKYTDVLELK